MIRRNNEKVVEFEKDLFEGGKGTLEIRNILNNPEEMDNKGSLFAHCILEPGASVGFHIHEDEAETYYICSGKAEYNDNGDTTTISTGDVTYTAAGEGHGMKNIGADPVEFIALILDV